LLRDCSVAVPRLFRGCSAAVPRLFRGCSAAVPRLFRDCAMVATRRTSNPNRVHGGGSAPGRENNVSP
ncbi:hypothetical protein KI387_024984, partial [Taxus chinensis]